MQSKSPLNLLGVRPFGTLFLSSMVTHLGIWTHMVAAGWMMTSLTQSKTMVALVQSSQALPVMALALIAGVVADSFERRHVLMVAQVLGMLVSVLLAGITFFELTSAPVLLILSCLVGAALAIHLPAWQTSVSEFVGKENLPAAVSLNSMGVNLMRTSGPAFGGIIVALWGASVAFALTALCYVPLLFALLTWKAPVKDARLPREKFGTAISAGLRYAAMTPALQRIMLRGALFGASAIALQALLPLVVRQELGATAGVYGMLLACFGGGAVSGALANVRLRARYSGELLVRWAFAANAIAAMLIALSGNVYAVGLGIFLGGAGWVLALNIFNVTLQLSSPRWVVGRAYALYQTCTFGGMAAGGWLWGALADATTITIALLCAVPLFCIGALVGLRWSLPDHQRMNLEPLDQFREPPLKIRLGVHGGPILVTTDYIIKTEDTRRFLDVMTARRRTRLRDGARQWALMRDLECPEHWTEKYLVFTWADYRRHNERRTQDDAQVYEQLCDLHQGAGRPTVKRHLQWSVVPDSALLPPLESELDDRRAAQV